MEDMLHPVDHIKLEIECDSKSPVAKVKPKFYAQHFREAWTADPDMKDWIRRVDGDSMRAYCKFCRQTLAARVKDLKRHGVSSKHLRCVGAACNGISIKDDVSFDNDPASCDGDNDDNSFGCYSSAENKSTDFSPARIGFLGFDKTAEWLLYGFLGNGIISRRNVQIGYTKPYKFMELKSMKSRLTNDLDRVAEESDIIFLCGEESTGKDNLYTLTTLRDSHNPIFVSLIDGLTITTLEELVEQITSHPRIFRAVINSPSYVGQACCVFSSGGNIFSGDKEVVRSLLSSVGNCNEVSEELLGSIYRFTMSGPALFCVALEAFTDGAVNMGIPRELAAKLATQIVKGTACMAIEGQLHLSQLKDFICSKKGPELSSLIALEKSSFRGAMLNAVEASGVETR